MAKPHRDWHDLSIGLLATTAVIATALGVLIFGRVGTLHGKTFRLFVTAKGARGVQRGTEVWLDGKKVGLVRDIGFQSPIEGPDDRIVLTLSVLENAHPRLRTDTRVAIRPGASFIGDEVVALTSGTLRSDMIAAGDTIHAQESIDTDAMSAEFAQGKKELPAIFANVALLHAQLQSVDGTLGAFGVYEGDREMRRARARVSEVLSHLASREGSLRQALAHRDRFMARAREALAQVDSLRTLLSSHDHTLGRFRRDTALVRQITQIRDGLAALRDSVDAQNGTMMRVRADSAIMLAVHRDLDALDALIADMKKHPLRYTPF